jgi:acetyltransferase
MEQTQIFQALSGVRGQKPVDIEALERIVVRFSRLVLEQPFIKELDINPLLAGPEGIVALDARIVLHEASMAAGQLPRPAIRAYPAQYVSPWTTKAGLSVLIRPIRPEDEPALATFHEMLSDRSVYLRYFHMEKLSERVAHERLLRKCFIDYDREMALVVETTGANPPEILGIGRLTKASATTQGEVAVLVADRHQREGIGTELLGRLIAIARDEKLQSIEANLLAENAGMRALGDHFGFVAQASADPGQIRAVLTL